MNRPIIYRHNHPLARKSGRVRKSRFVLYEKLNGIPSKCHWCSCPLTWETLCADHLDSNTENNTPENLVASCRGCNASRDDGTGHGRKKEKKCSECGLMFIGISHHSKQIYCSIKCAAKNRPKTGHHSPHGTRSRYVTGCRCSECKYINSKYWRDKYGKRL